MPMPEAGSNWPPRPWNNAYSRYRDWDAWLTGDPDKLRYVYGGRGEINGDRPDRARVHPSQYYGGVLGRMSRWLWGPPPSLTERDSRVHFPLPADIATTVADLLFSEQPKLSAPQPKTTPRPSPTPKAPGGANSKLQDRLDVMVEDGLFATLRDAAAVASAFGDVYLRPVIDEDVRPGRSFLTAVHADGALPVFRWGQLTEVTFWTCLDDDQNGDAYVRLLEHHEPGRISYKIFKGTRDKLGTEMSQGALAEYAPYALLQEQLDQSGSMETGIDELDVVRIRNDGPQYTWRTQPLLKYLGRSDFDGSEQWFDRGDEVWTSLLIDLHHARSRLLIPQFMMQDLGAGRGARFDADQEFFMALNTVPKETTGDTPITPVQFKIRVEEHLRMLSAVKEVAVGHARLSMQTMGEQGDDVAMTATEVQARERRSFTSRGNRLNNEWRPGVPQAIRKQLLLEQARFRTGIAPVVVNMEFGDSVSESPETMARTAQLLRDAQAASDDTLVRMLHQDWDDDQVREEVDKISKAREAMNPPPLADPNAMDFGGDKGGPSDPSAPSKPGDTQGGKPPAK